MRSLTLNVYGIEDAAVQDFVCSQPASNYFAELAIGMTEQCQVCWRCSPPNNTYQLLRCQVPSSWMLKAGTPLFVRL